MPSNSFTPKSRPSNHQNIYQRWSFLGINIKLRNLFPTAYINDNQEFIPEYNIFVLAVNATIAT